MRPFFLITDSKNDSIHVKEFVSIFDYNQKKINKTIWKIICATYDKDLINISNNQQLNYIKMKEINSYNGNQSESIRWQII